jgi:DNA-binding CsgD family transcriptional regulator
MAFLDSWHTRVIVLYPLRRRYEKQLHQFITYGLSRREMDVVQLGLKEQTNEEISKNLGISKATLKTHLNNIFKKIPEVRGKNWRRIPKLSQGKNGDMETS